MRLEESLERVELSEVGFSGSYDRSDVCFLLKEISDQVVEQETFEREKAIQSGTHYSEMLPVEYKPSDEYIKLFHDSLDESAFKLARATALVSHKIIKNRGENIVLVSLARAGIPVGILIKRYISQKLGLDLKHYSISIIRGKGIDENAVNYILKNHNDKEIQFIDGWTGKGMITRVLEESCKIFFDKYGVSLNPDLAVLADPGYCVKTFGTREDFLIPSACLNSTVSGLVSRTVLRNDIIGPSDFHGVKYYKELSSEDLSNYFVDKISAYFKDIDTEEIEMRISQASDEEPDWIGMKDVETVGSKFGIKDINHIKPGIGETTRVLLRRVPWKVLVRDLNDVSLKNVFQLAKEKGIEVEPFDLKSYKCIGIIKPLEER